MAAWADLPLDLVNRILGHLPCLAHRAAFGAVCTNWRAVAALAQPPRQIPWLLLPYAAAEEPVFFCIRCRELHRAFLPDEVRTARYCGSHPGGWLALALNDYLLQEGGCALRNLHTGEQLGVPGVLETPDDAGEVVTIVLGAALSAAPTADGAFLAVVLEETTLSPIAFWIPGMDHLSPPTPLEPHQRDSWRNMLPRAEIADVIYFAGHGLKGFHVLTNAEEVLVYTPEFALDGKLTTRLVTYRFPDHKASDEPGCTASRYLLDFFDELVMVVRFVSTEQNEGTRRIYAFHLSLLEQAGNHGDRQAQWKRVWFSDKVVVMLGRCSSMAFISPVVALDGLYFLDDTNSFVNVMTEDVILDWEGFPCRDMGRWTVHHESEQVEQVFPVRPPSDFSPAVWLFHSNPANA